MPLKKYFKIDEAAHYLGVSRSQIYKLTKCGLPYIRDTDRGALHFDIAAIDAWRQSNQRNSKIQTI